MKIAILNIHNGMVERGAEVWTDNLASRWGKKDQVDVYQIGKKKGKNYHQIIISNIPFIKRGFFYHLSVFFFTLFCLPVFWRQKYDWYIPVNGRSQAVIIRLMRFFTGGKILIAGHAGIGMEDRLNIVLGRPDVFVALTKKAEIWAKAIARSKTRVLFIANGVDTEIFTPKGRKAEIRLSKPLVLCVSEILPYKRIPALIKAVSLLKNVSLLLIGRGSGESFADKLGQELLGSRYLRLERIDHCDIPAYYRGADIFSLPSEESEAFGLVYLEAMASGLPVVAPDDANRKAIIGNAGIYTRVENSKDYAGAISQALKTDFGNIPGKQALKYTWEIIARKYEKILSEGQPPDLIGG